MGGGLQSAVLVARWIEGSVFAKGLGQCDALAEPKLFQRVFRKFLSMTVFESQSPFLTSQRRKLSELDVQSVTEAAPELSEI